MKKDGQTTKATVKVERGVCGNCVHCKLFSDGKWHCNFYPAYPNRINVNEYCKVDNNPLFGFEHK